MEDSDKPQDAGVSEATPKPVTRKFKDTTRRLRRERKGKVGHRPSVDWASDMYRVSEPFGDTVDYVGIDELLVLLDKSRTGRSLFDGARRPKVVYDPQSICAQYYPQEHVVSLHPHKSRAELTHLLVRELRRAWHRENGTLCNPLHFEPDSAILVNRAQAADAFTMAVRVAWELKLADEPEAWNFLVRSPMGDVGRVFETHAQADFRTLNNGVAARAAYDKWFEESRTKVLDKGIIHQMLLDEANYISADCRLKKADHLQIACLGNQPEGNNYLTLPGFKSASDHDYGTVEDRSNANFLWFVKFERSFQEKERQMIETAVKSSAEIVDFAKKMKETTGRPPRR